MFDRYPNLFIDIAWVALQLGRQPRAARSLLMKHPDRVLFGTDVFPLRASIFHVNFRLLETADESFSYTDEPVPGSGRWSIYGLELPLRCSRGSTGTMPGQAPGTHVARCRTTPQAVGASQLRVERRPLAMPVRTEASAWRPATERARDGGRWRRCTYQSAPRSALLSCPSEPQRGMQWSACGEVCGVASTKRMLPGQPQVNGMTASHPTGCAPRHVEGRSAPRVRAPRPLRAVSSGPCAGPFGHAASAPRDR